MCSSFDIIYPFLCWRSILAVAVLFVALCFCGWGCVGGAAIVFVWLLETCSWVPTLVLLVIVTSHPIISFLSLPAGCSFDLFLWHPLSFESFPSFFLPNQGGLEAPSIKPSPTVSVAQSLSRPWLLSGCAIRTNYLSLSPKPRNVEVDAGGLRCIVLGMVRWMSFVSGGTFFFVILFWFFGFFWICCGKKKEGMKEAQLQERWTLEPQPRNPYTLKHRYKMGGHVISTSTAALKPSTNPKP